MVLLGRSRRTWMLAPGREHLLFLLCLIRFCLGVTAWPQVSKVLEDECPGPRWNSMCRSCCEYERILCTCPSQRTRVGYAVPCCLNDIDQCDPCIIHQGCSVFDNCKRCNNGTWQAKDDFYIDGRYCAQCRPGWSGGDCLGCGGAVRWPQGQVTLEGYPINARCDWTLHVGPGFAMELRFTMLSLEFNHRCQYDYIEIRDGGSISSPVIGRYCGDEIPPPIRSSGSSLHVRFVSDGYNNYDGFSAIFQELSACRSDPCMNGGTCSHSAPQAFRCACQTGYAGQRCEIKRIRPGCSAPEKPAHGDRFLQYDEDDSASTVQYICHEPYRLRGASWRTCLSDGTWSGAAPTCTTACSSLPSLHHGFSSDVTDSDGELDGVDFHCSHPYILKGDGRRRCRTDGSWTGSQPQCVRACREPKISKLVRQRVLKSQLASRQSPVHGLFSSRQEPDEEQSRSELPDGYHGLYTRIEYECISPLYQSSGSARRTCLRTGKWSGRHVSCSPVCGRISVKPKALWQTRWPWHAAVYRRLTLRTARRGDSISEVRDWQREDPDERPWQLVCSGALVSQRAVLVPAHCVAEPGRSLPVGAADLKVVMSKHDPSVTRISERSQHVWVSEIVIHPNYDPNVFDSDVAVLKLAEKVRISPSVSPVCLPPTQGGEVTAAQAYAAGWSVSAEGSVSESSQTHVIELADVTRCERQYTERGLPNIITGNTLCGRQRPVGSGTICPVRVGGIVLLPSHPLTGPDTGSDTQWELLGLVGFGYDGQKCDSRFYTVYTRVARFKNWIMTNIK